MDAFDDMMLKRMADAIEVAWRRGSYAGFVGAQPERDIELLEATLGYRLPRDYRLFLRHFGTGSVRGCEICGLFSNCAATRMWPSTYSALDMTREDGQPADRLIISTDGADGRYCIMTTELDDKQCAPVVWCTFYPPHEIEERWATFVDFFVDMASNP
jgi:hypothetical protein